LLSCSNRGPVALCTLDLGLLNPPSSPGWQISTGYNWEGIRQVRATLLGARHVPERPCGGCVYLWRYIKCSTFTFDLSGSRHRSRDHSNPNGPFPIGGPLDTSLYLHPFSIYLALSIFVSRP